MRILCIGDIVGKPGRRVVSALVPALRRELSLDVVVANGENAAAGRGLSASTAREIFAAQVDVITSGNHIWAQPDIIPQLDSDALILRPANYPPGARPRHLHVRRPDGDQLDGPRLRTRSMTPSARRTACWNRCRQGRRSSSICTRRRRARRSRSRGTWTGACRRSSRSHTHVPTAGCAAVPRRHGVRLRPGHVWAARLRDRRRRRAGASEVPDGHAHPLHRREKSRAVVFNSVLIDLDDPHRRRALDRAGGQRVE